MSVLTTDAWALALAAAMAMLLAHTALALARSVSAVSARNSTCIVLLSSLALRRLKAAHSCSWRAASRTSPR